MPRERPERHYPVWDIGALFLFRNMPRHRTQTNGAKPVDTTVQLQESVETLRQDNIVLTEQLRTLELALENLDWRQLTWQSQYEFSREGLRIITELARLFYLKNPMLKRGIEVQRLYVWGQGWSVKAKDEAIQEVITNFLDDAKNQVELTGHTARMLKETELRTDGNLFLVWFVNINTGRVRVRSIPMEEIQDIHCNPEDAKEPWYYRRSWNVQTMLPTGGVQTETRQAYYPDWKYNPTSRPSTIGNIPVMWDTPVFHIKTGGFSNWKFGVSEIYAACDWGRAYKEFLEDWASIVRAYRKFAFQLTTPGGKSGIAAAKTKLNTTVGGATGRGLDTNPPPIAGSTFISSPDVTLQPVRTAGATVSAEDGRRILLMVCAAVGLPETFFGDVSVGTLATANSLDRPTELAMRDRQTFWAHIFKQIFDFVLLWAVKAPSGPLAGMGTLVTEVEAGQVEERIDWGETKNHIDIEFPPIINAGLKDQIGAIISSGTLDGKSLAGTVDIVTLTRMLLVALGEDDVDEIMEKLFPGGQVPDWADPAKQHELEQKQFEQQPAAKQSGLQQKEAIREVRSLRDSLYRLMEVAA